MTPAEKTLQKALASSSISSERWDVVRAELRDRAFFSSRIESLRFLNDARKAVADLLSEVQTDRGTTFSREDAIRKIREAGERLRKENPNVGLGGLLDPSSRRRAALIVDTNAGLAAGYVRHLADTEPGALAAFPAKELFRLPQSNPVKPRDWRSRWVSNGGSIYAGRMIAPVNDPIWVAISRFGEPYPPFDYNSGMSTRPVSRSECLDLGVPLPIPGSAEGASAPSFNDSLSATVDVGHWETESVKFLQDKFKDQIQLSQDADGNVTAAWKAHLVRDFFMRPPEKGERGALRTLGKATDAAVRLTPESARENLAGKSVSITRELKDHMIKQGHWPKETRKSNLQISSDELDLIPAIWREPDRIVQGDGNALVFELDSFSEGTFCLVVEVWKTGAKVLTFYKRK